MSKDRTRPSKFLSLVLRHQPEVAGISLDAQGWASIDALLAGAAANGLLISYEELEEIVATNEKNRFVICSETRRIRANQGHSVSVDLQLQERAPPPLLYHGTATRFLEAIRAEGLCQMRRHHVHLSADEATARQVGVRHGQVAVIEIDAAAMHEAGHRFFLSANGVWLVESVPAAFFREIRG